MSCIEFCFTYCSQLSEDGQPRSRSRTPAGDEDDGEDEEDSDDGRKSRSKTPPPAASREGGIRVSVTSPPSSLLSPAGAGQPSLVSPFGSPSTWITTKPDGGTEGTTAPTAVAASTAGTNNVRINGDHVTQVRVDALVLEPDHHQRRPAEEDRDQGELIVSPRSVSRNSSNKEHVTAVHVEHNSHPP